MIGVDEAGKGPVLGSMFVAAVEYDETLALDVDDSKQLAPERRLELADDIQSNCTVAEVEVTASEIDSYVSGDETTMNDLMVAAHAEALTRLDVIGEAVVDASDTSENRFQRRVTEALEARDADVTVTAEHGADESYPGVSAASIVAKVNRDRHVERISREHGEDVGSGYPGDPRTIEFLKSYVESNGELPPDARESWSTSRDVLGEHRQSTVTDF